MRSRARHWSRTAFGVSVLFGALALGCRLFLGAWPFDGALELVVLSAALGVYFQILSRRHRTVPDGAVLLDQALQLAGAGRIDDAIETLTKAVRQSPHLWQAFQYRGELYLARQNPAAAVRDFDEAIRLAPGEQHLYRLREQANDPAGAV